MAWMLDLIPFQILLLCLADGGKSLPSLTSLGVLWVGYFFWHTGFEGVFNLTPGKYVLGLSVQTETGRPLTYLDCVKRFFGSGFSWLTLNFGHMLGLMRPDRRMGHDLLSHTLVVNHARRLGVLLPVTSKTAHHLWTGAALAFELGWCLVLVVQLSLWVSTQTGAVSPFFIAG
jgi:uncharacterized RDD family membrane protein YckC